MNRPARIVCEITAPRRPLAAALCRIARTCAQESGQPLVVRSRCVRRRSVQTSALATVVLHLPAELAATQHPVWCLACQLACFCPTTRVSVLVHGESSFQPAAAKDAMQAAS